MLMPMGCGRHDDLTAQERDDDDRFEAILQVKGRVFNLGSFAGAENACAVLASARLRAR